MQFFPFLCAGALLASAVSAQDTPTWLLVRSDARPAAKGARTLATFGWERLANGYLKRDYKIVGADEADSHPKASRLVAGTPHNNTAVKHLAATLGVACEGKQLSYKGRTYPEDAGLAIVTDDPDGGGRLVLFVGATELGAYHCLSVSVDIATNGYVAMTWQKALHRGKVGEVEAARMLQTNGETLRIIRLDRDLFRIRKEFADSPDEAALRVSRAFAGYQKVFERALKPGVDLLEFTRAQFGQQSKMLDAVEQRFAAVDLEELLRGIDVAVATSLGGRTGPRPIVHVIVTRPGITNAQVIGRDPATDRMRVTLNLAAFEDLATLRLAVTHEFVHTLQRSHDGTLLARSIHEGVATFVSQELVSGCKDHDALMWSATKLAAAKQREVVIFAAFDKLKDTRDMRRMGQFLHLGSPLRTVRGAPDRCGYYVGWRAVSAWRAANPDRPLADLLTVGHEELFAALDG